MDLQALAAAEMKRRAALLPTEVSGWVKQAKNNEDLMGIHGSQLLALEAMMNERAQAQQDLILKLDPSSPPADFARVLQDLSAEVAGLHELWRAFRLILDQQRDVAVADSVLTATLVAADAFNSCLRAAAAIPVPAAAQHRPPPLVYFAASVTPETVNRGGRVEQLGLAVERYKRQVLPIPVVFVPLDQTISPWRLVALHHEVGHNIDEELGLSAEIAEKMLKAIEPRDPQRARKWAMWAGEAVADALAVLMGGAGVASGLAGLFLVMAARQDQFDPNDEHPPHLPRAVMLAALLAQPPAGAGVTDVPQWAQAAQQIQTWIAARPVPPQWAQDYSSDVGDVVSVLLNAPLTALAGKTLRDLAPERSRDAELTQRLASYFQTKFNRPQPDDFPWVLVPPAAQLALQALLATETPDRAMTQVRDMTAEFCRAIHRPVWLGQAGGYTEAVRQRTRALQFR